MILIYSPSISISLALIGIALHCTGPLFEFIISLDIIGTRVLNLMHEKVLVNGAKEKKTILLLGLLFVDYSMPIKALFYATNHRLALSVKDQSVMIIVLRLEVDQAWAQVQRPGLKS